MLKLPLEFLLEKGFAELGIGLNRRVYAEDVVTEAAVDDAFGETTVAAYVKSAQESGVPIGENAERLTPAQWDVLAFEGQPSFFTRTSNPIRGWTVEYRVESTEQRDFYESEADRLIREGKVAEQYVVLNYCGRSNIQIDINTMPDDPNKVKVISSDMDNVADSQLDALNQILELDETPFDSSKVSGAVIDFLRELYEANS